MGLLMLVVAGLCVNFVICENTYKVAIVTSADGLTAESSIVRQVTHMNADMLVLPSTKVPLNSLADIEDYDEVIKRTSALAKTAGAYIVSQIYEKTVCQNKVDLVKSNLVFDRQGSIVAVYRKPLHNIENCTSNDQVPIFTTDFGVTFGLLMEEDLVLIKPDQLRVKNILVAGDSQSKVPFLNGPLFSSSWAFTTNANLVASYGVYAGKAGFKTSPAIVGLVELNKNGGEANPKCTTSATVSSIPAEDLSQYIIKPLDMAATVRGHSQSVCHGKFCCHFYVKTSYVGSPQHEVSYGLAVYKGVRQFTESHHIGARSCSVVACAGLYKRSCALGPNNSTNTHFEKITISGNFTEDSTQFPLVISTSGSQKIYLDRYESNRATITVLDGKNLLNFGIFSRDYSNDFKSKSFEEKFENETYYDYFFNEDVQEFFDYLWIRLRIMIFIVSIYVLEMM